MTHDLLGGEDAAWLHMEEATNPMVVNGFLELAAPLPFHSAYALLERFARIPRFRDHVVDPSLRVGRASWAGTPDFDLEQHVEHVVLESTDDAELRAFVGRAVSGLLDMKRPLWHVYVIDRPGPGGHLAGTALLFRIHHSIADGFALLGVLLSLCDHGVARAETPAPRQRRRSRRVTDAAIALARLVVLPADPKTLLKGPLGLEKRVAWSEPLALTAVKEAAHMTSATVNDVLVATAAGALGRYLARRGETTAGLELRAMVPVNLRPGAATEALGNRFGLLVLGLPIGVEDPLQRVRAVHERMNRLKGTPEAVVTNGLLRGMGWAPRPVEDLAVWFFGLKTSLVLTNVPGPRAPLKLAGVPVSRIMFWVPQSGRMGLGISIFSYASQVTIGIIADATIVPDPETLVADLHAEYAALEALVRRPITPALAQDAPRGPRA